MGTPPGVPIMFLFPVCGISKALVKAEMEQDFGWDNKPAKRYMELFHQMLGW